jgi:hypothetical protein
MSYAFDAAEVVKVLGRLRWSKDLPDSAGGFDLNPLLETAVGVIIDLQAERDSAKALAAEVISAGLGCRENAPEVAEYDGGAFALTSSHFSFASTQAMAAMVREIYPNFTGASE